jgi:3-isopropylmalate/(R)-2-methylmalate dehydratase small subunit
MKALRQLESAALAIPRANVDTDQIVPARFLKRPRSENFGDVLFHDQRQLLGPAGRGDARIVVAGRNFGCGSSREHAVWALYDYGFRAAIAPSFGDIFRSNALKNGFLPVVLPEEAVMAMLEALARAPASRIALDVERQTVTAPDGTVHRFDIEPFARQCLLEGLDELDYTLTQAARIAEFERHYEAP